MAGLTSRCGDHVGSRLEFWRHVQVISRIAMTGSATGGNAGVLHRCAGERGEAAHSMTGLARRSRRQVSRLLGFRDQALLISRRTTMAVVATTGDADVPHRCASKRDEVDGRVTGLARRSRRQVVRLLELRRPVHRISQTLVAAFAIIDDTNVVHHRTAKRVEVVGIVAVLARALGRKMVRPLDHQMRRPQETLAGAVALRAVVGDTVVVHHSRHKLGRAMAERARLRRRKVAHRQCGSARCRLEARRVRVTALARCRGYDVVSRFGWCRDA